jgi:hypothetical protein
MKIAVMTSWNDETGAAVHAKALVNAWLDMGHKVTELPGPKTHSQDRI